MTGAGLTRRSLIAAGLLAGGPGLARAAIGGHTGKPVGIELEPLLRLTTQAGTRVERRQLRGRPAIVVFGYTRCPEVCPTTLHELSTHLAALGPAADRLGVFFVTVDPERDTVTVLRDYLSSFDPRIVALTGSVEEVREAAVAFGAGFGKTATAAESGDYSMSHSYLLYLLDRYGLLAATVPYGAPASRLAELSGRLLAQ